MIHRPVICADAATNLDIWIFHQNSSVFEKPLKHFSHANISFLAHFQPVTNILCKGCKTDWWRKWQVHLRDAQTVAPCVKFISIHVTHLSVAVSGHSRKKWCEVHCAKKENHLSSIMVHTGTCVKYTSHTANTLPHQKCWLQIFHSKSNNENKRSHIKQSADFKWFYCFWLNREISNVNEFKGKKMTSVFLVFLSVACV